MNDQLITPEDTNQSPASPNGVPENEPNPPIEPKKSNGTIVLISILMLLVGGVAGYFITKTYFPKTETATVDVPIVPEEVSETTSATTPEDNWKLESEQVVDAYLGYFHSSGPTLEGVKKIAQCEPGVSTVKCTSLKELRTSKFNNYLNCITDSAQANNVESGMLINFDPVIGAQDVPKSHEINNAIKEGEKVTVISKLNYDKPIDLNFYLIEENGKWLINATDVSNKFIASEYGCSQYETK